jgi:hypothetical protein
MIFRGLCESLAGCGALLFFGGARHAPDVSEAAGRAAEKQEEK